MKEILGLPPVETVVGALESDLVVRQSVQHNLNVWRKTWGAFEVLRDVRIDFDPRRDYWYLTERRVVVAYLASFYEECFRPAAALRNLAFDLVQRFERARQNAAFGESELATRHPWGWTRLREALASVAREIPRSSEYEVLKGNWRHLKDASLVESFGGFLERFQNATFDNLEPSLSKRLAWFPYLGLRHLDELRDRQRFFTSFYTLFTSTNAYKVGGAQTFASVLQNNSTGMLLGLVDRWVAGESPEDTGFIVNMRDTENRDARRYTTVLELYGFLNLDTQPFYNSAAEVYEQARGEQEESMLPALRRIGDRTVQALRDNPGLVEKLSRAFLDDLQKLSPPELVAMEGIVKGEECLADPAIAVELQDKALARAKRLTPEAAAAIYFHLALDGFLYTHRAVKPPNPPPKKKEPGRQVEKVAEPQPKAAPTAIPVSTVVLPPALHSRGNNVLAFLKAGFHVLLAGAPGTGKTILAQFVGHAWNRGLSMLETRIPSDEAPKTTVANSAWAPFHTIGGIVPDGKGGYDVQRGIFIDPDFDGGDVWQLLPQCLVLDEMNRADLDRCVGELYPLLSHSVGTVVPAGIPGVREIRDHPRFRVVATVNDASIDDIVFPISEGLNRRFIRIELPGADSEEVQEYLAARAAPARQGQLDTAKEVVREFFRLAKKHGLLKTTEPREHLQFGVGYFNLLAAWVAGDLEMPKAFTEQDLDEQAIFLLETSLRSTTRDRSYEAVFADLRRGPLA
jgi:MoxR-like ATPase